MMKAKPQWGCSTDPMRTDLHFSAVYLSFNQNKQTGTRTVQFGEKTVFEAIV